MRNIKSLSISTCLLAGTVLPLFAAAPDTKPDLTVIVDMKGPWSPVAIKEMEREASQILEPSGMRLDWRRRETVADSVFRDLVVMTFRGSCQFGSFTPRYDELGPLAFTRTSDGTVQPFGEVNCDHVVNSVREAMFGADYVRSEVLLGRALGRVVAHELVHMLTNSGDHAHDGVQRASLSGKQLIAASLSLSPGDLERVKAVRRQSPAASSRALSAADPADSTDETRP